MSRAIMQSIKSSIRPSFIRLKPNSEQKFSVEPDHGPVSWSVDGIKGGNEEVGVIDPNGLYTPPQKTPSAEHVICAEIDDTETKRLWATVILGDTNTLYECVDYWNRKGKGNEELKGVHGIAIESSGDLLITDPSAARVLRFSISGEYLGEIGNGKGSEPGSFKGPRDVEVHPSGDIYVIDGDKCQIQVFTAHGEFLRYWGHEGSDEGGMARPHAMAISEDGVIHVADVDNNRVDVFDETGSLIECWGGKGTAPGEFIAPHGIEIDPNGDVFVAECKGRCQKLSSDGDPIIQFANPVEDGKSAHGYYRYHDMASDNLGNVYLMSRDRREKGRKSIDKYNNNGDLITRFRQYGPNDGKNGNPCAAVSEDGTVYTTESGNVAGVGVFRPK